MFQRPYVFETYTQCADIQNTCSSFAVQHPEEARGDDPPVDTADLETPLEDLFSVRAQEAGPGVRGLYTHSLLSRLLLTFLRLPSGNTAR